MKYYQRLTTVNTWFFVLCLLLPAHTTIHAAPQASSSSGGPSSGSGNLPSGEDPPRPANRSTCSEAKSTPRTLECSFSPKDRSEDPFTAILIFAPDSQYAVDLHQVLLGDQAVPASLADHHEMARGAASLPGGFLRTFSPALPAGEVINNGASLNARSADPLLNGKVCFTSGGMAIMRSNAHLTLDKTISCRQSGPLLMPGQPESGDQVLAFWAARRRRSIVVKAEGGIAMIYTEPASLYAAVEFLQWLPTVAIKPVAALNLTGGQTAGLIWEGGRRGSTSTALPDAIVVRARAVP